jgi:hypothetical protein
LLLRLQLRAARTALTYLSPQLTPKFANSALAAAALASCGAAGLAGATLDACLFDVAATGTVAVVASSVAANFELNKVPPACPGGGCGAGGTCTVGKCVCAAGYSGNNCEVACPNACGGHGTCLPTGCNCNAGCARSCKVVLRAHARAREKRARIFCVPHALRSLAQTTYLHGLCSYSGSACVSALDAATSNAAVAGGVSAGVILAAAAAGYYLVQRRRRAAAATSGKTEKNLNPVYQPGAAAVHHGADILVPMGHYPPGAGPSYTGAVQQPGRSAAAMSGFNGVNPIHQARRM